MKEFHKWIRKWFLLLRRRTYIVFQAIAKGIYYIFYSASYITYIVFEAIVIILIRQYSKANNAQRERTKERLRYFNPIIKKDFWGNEITEWVGREKPLTDEELNQLM
jgi:hypothetical protein